MRIPRIFTHTKLQDTNTVLVESKAHKHIKDVLRLNINDKIILFNGDGYDYFGSICELSKKQLSIQISSRNKALNESPLFLHLLQPLCRSEKMDWCLQKATELGVKKITPFISSRVNVSITQKRIEKKMVHWNSVIESACEQCGRANLPILEAPTSYQEAISSIPSNTRKIIASPTANNNALENLNLSTSKCACVIGPEGGFDNDELNLAENAGFIAIKFGPRILRLETAVVSAVTLCQSRWGDFI